MARGTPIPQVRIIDHKKVWMTNDEYLYYESICKGYDKPNFNGKDLFQDHFEANDDGIILFVKPPHKKYSSMEVYTFLISLQVNQQLRLAQEQVLSLVKETKENLIQIFTEASNLREELRLLKEAVENTKAGG